MSEIDHVAEMEAIDGWRAGDREAGARLLKMHAGLIVVSVRRHCVTRCPMEDLIQVGSIAMLRAAVKFDASTGVAFAAYASKTIRNAALDYRRTSTSDISGSGAAHGAASELRSPRTNGRPLSFTVATTLRRNRGPLIQLQRPAVRLDGPRTIDDDSKSLDMLEASTPPADEQLHDHHERVEVQALLGALSPVARDVIQRHYLADEPETLEQIGLSYGRTRERIRQIEAEAIAKMKRRAFADFTRPAC